MSLPLLHAGKSAPGLSAALDLRFALDKSLTAYRGPTPSFSRASTGTYFNSSGVLTTAAINGARFNHTFNGTSWVSRGLLLEEQRTNLALNSEVFSDASWSKAGSSTVTADVSIWVNGNTVADRINYPSNSLYKSVYRGFTSTSAAYTISLFAKAGTASWLGLCFGVTGAGDAIGDGVFFNLSNGTIGTQASGSIGAIQACGDGWYRCSVTRTLSAGTSYLQIEVHTADNQAGNFSSAGTENIFVCGAQAELGAFPTSYIGTTSSSVVRSADVCQITGSDFSGFWNASEGTFAVDFDKIGVKTSASATSILFGTTNNNNTPYEVYYEDYNGSEYFRDFSGSSQFQINTGASTPANSTIKIAGCYKANDVAISKNGASVLTDATVTLFGSQTTLTIGDINPGQAPINGHIARLRYFNKRLPNATLQLLSEPDPTLNLQFALNKSLTPVAGPAPSFSRASTGTYFNASGVLTSASINTPRFDHVYSGGQWVSRGLLIEEQRTNGFLRSNEFSNAATWFTSNNLVSTDSTTSPDGTIAFKVTPTTSSNAEKNIFQLATIANSLNTHSIYVKSGTQNFIQLMFTGGDTNYANFNISSGVTGNKSAGVSSSTISDVGNGWYRISVTLTNSGASGFAIFWINSLTDSRAPSTTSTGSIYLFGAQYEIGAFPTSYIGTTSSPVVRSADVCQITGTSFGWMWNQGEGSVIAEWDTYSASSPQVVASASAAASPSNNLIVIRNEAFFGYVSGIEQFLLAYSVTSNTPNKVSGAYKTNDFAASLNGAAVLTDTTGTLPTQSQFDIGQTAAYTTSPYKLNGHIAKLLYYPARLTNTKLQQLST